MEYIIRTNEDFEQIKNLITDYDIIFFQEGSFRIKHSFPQNNIKICGISKEKTIITNDDHYHKIMEDFNECNTFRTYTIEILGDNVQLENITIKNSCKSSIHGQAVALSVYGNNFNANNCSIYGEQDTLFTGPLPNDLKIRYKGFLTDLELNKNNSIQIYENCDLYGDVDFIFGCATALFKKCNIYCLNNRGFVCAPAHDKSIQFGYLFLNCHIINRTNSSNQSFYLARPWRDYGCAAFIDCIYDNHILEDGFNKWNDTNRDKTARFYEYNIKKYNRIDFVKILNNNEKDNYIQDFFKYID